MNKANKRYAQTEKGKQAKAKSTSKQKGQDWILVKPNPFALNVPVAYHHINNTDVVAIPLYLHQLYSYRCTPEFHQFMCMQIVKQVYKKNPQITTV